MFFIQMQKGRNSNVTVINTVEINKTTKKEKVKAAFCLELPITRKSAIITWRWWRLKSR